MNSLAADQYGPVPSGKYRIVSVNDVFSRANSRIGAAQ